MRIPVLPALAALLFALPAQAAPVAVTLYPSGALVTEEFQATPRDGALALDLPAALDEASLRFSLPEGAVRGVRLRTVDGGPDGPLAALRERRRDLQEHLDAETALQETLTRMSAFWTAPPRLLEQDPEDVSASVASLDTILGSRMEELVRQRLASERKAATLKAELRDVDERIAALGGERDTLRCTLETTASGPAAVRASYLVSSAGWSPRYEVEALPDQNLVRVGLRAHLWQNTGRDWNGAALTLSSSHAPAGVTPPPLTPPAARPVMLKAAARSNVLADAAPAGAAPVPAREEQAGASWKPGTLRLADASPLTIPLENRDLKASFLRLVRPSVSPSAWIQARLETAPGETPFLPAGEASFLLDGLLVGRDTFALSPADTALSFGRDPLVTVERTALPARAEEAEPGMEQTGLRWNIVLTNGHSSPVRVRVEEPAPFHRDASVRVQERSEPAPVLDEEKNAYVWELELPARGRVTIREDIRILTPRRDS